MSAVYVAYEFVESETGGLVGVYDDFFKAAKASLGQFGVGPSAEFPGEIDDIEISLPEEYDPDEVGFVAAGGDHWVTVTKMEVE